MHQPPTTWREDDLDGQLGQMLFLRCGTATEGPKALDLPNAVTWHIHGRGQGVYLFHFLCCYMLCVYEPPLYGSVNYPFFMYYIVQPLTEKAREPKSLLHWGYPECRQ